MYQEIIHQLYKKYYAPTHEHSEVTSSHWREMGTHDVEYSDGRWKTKGYGFGDFIPRNIVYSIRFFPLTFLSHSLLKQYRCPPFLVSIGKEIALRSGRVFEFDCAKQLLSLDMMVKKLYGSVEDLTSCFTKRGVKTVCVIGDGYGFFSTLLKLVDPDINVISVNLGKTLFFDVLFSQKCLPGEDAVLLTEENRSQIFQKRAIVFLEAEHYKLLQGLPIDLFVNIASMQEMDPPIAANYFQYMRASTSRPVYFYCCNREEKKLPDGTMVRFREYPWGDSKTLFDGLCPWYQKYPAFSPPFWRPFDGPVRHRMVMLK